MRTLLVVTAALGLLGASVGAADAQRMDSKGHCLDKSGKYAKMDVCKGMKPMIGPMPMKGPAHSYKLDAKGGCHDEKGKMAAKTFCKH